MKWMIIFAFLVWVSFWTASEIDDEPMPGCCEEPDWNAPLIKIPLYQKRDLIWLG